MKLIKTHNLKKYKIPNNIIKWANNKNRNTNKKELKELRKIIFFNLWQTKKKKESYKCINNICSRNKYQNSKFNKNNNKKPKLKIKIVSFSQWKMKLIKDN